MTNDKRMNLTPQQQTAASAKASVAVIAGAGTGKTHMLAARYLHHITSHGLSPLQVVACTFTEKAAAELRHRIRQGMQTGSQFDGLQVRSELEAAFIGTIHGLAARICREHPAAAGVPPDFTVLDEIAPLGLGSTGKIWLVGQLDLALDSLPDEIYEKIPYSLLRQILAALLADPIAAEKALAVKVSADDMASKLRQQALEQLQREAGWRDAIETLGQFAGPVSDRREQARQDALNALQLLETDPPQALENLNSISLKGGSKKQWPDGGFQEISDAISTLKNISKKAVKYINLQPGAADEQMAQMLPVLRRAFELSRDLIAQAKRKARVLDFADLEVYARKALQNAEVREYYAQQWQAFLVDEFQDTNPVQGEILELLLDRETRDKNSAILTIVGDAKQSIYGFRRANVELFHQWQERIVAGGGEVVELATSFRTNTQLVQNVNSIFQPILGNLHQNLDANRSAPNAGPYIQAGAVSGDKGINAERCRQAEAQYIASQVKQWLSEPMLVHDKQGDEIRHIAPGDIAILSRTWDPLELYGEALASAGIPTVLASGGSLLDTREAKDALALLRFLADPADDIALVALLRSPFFALSDRILFQAVTKEDISWWQRIKASEIPELRHPVAVLGQLLAERHSEAPTRLLQIADRLTGYTAVIANMPGAARREADGRGFMDLLRQLQGGNYDIFTVVRQLEQLQAGEISVPRPPLEAKNAVALMTVHAAKGLEWPVVVVPDLARGSKNFSPPVYFDPNWGVGMQLSDEEGNDQKPVAYLWLENLRQSREAAEMRRVLYVALTRARDNILLTAAANKGGAFEGLLPGLLAAHIPIQPIPLTVDDLSPPCASLPEPPIPPSSPPLLGSVGSGLFELPVTALSEYDRCPKRFHYRFVEGHPGTGSGPAISQRVGTLVHFALERDVRSVEILSLFDLSLPREYVEEALSLCLRWDQLPIYQAYRQAKTERERHITLNIDGLQLVGVVDLLGPDFVLDFKTDADRSPHHHRFQLWAYAEATQRPQAHIAYLRHDYLYTFPADYFRDAGVEVKSLVKGILAGDYPPHSWPANCHTCPYAEICPECCSLGSEVQGEDLPF
ncbi:MAG TPA: UvrD-helicase domain-containing protein [Oscillatoriaceae cyanobacterium M33_DOE_052]|uniref:DNA 3'-5' helicase n=1 Tax=Planktothricoides sp. SpSt-374 TaxID=2282167 RepID=A0A7C3ZHV1_9CYAN|nr:UvrD-helicase domain-containing protein [Oscillatoriaceae cyanobacterium M33_DOE_052]